MNEMADLHAAVLTYLQTQTDINYMARSAPIINALLKSFEECLVGHNLVERLIGP